MFFYHITHAECLGGDIDLLCNQRAMIGSFPWRLVDGESCTGRCVAMVEGGEHQERLARRENLLKTGFGDCYDPEHVERINALTRCMWHRNSSAGRRGLRHSGLSGRRGKT